MNDIPIESSFLILYNSHLSEEKYVSFFLKASRLTEKTSKHIER